MLPFSTCFVKPDVYFEADVCKFRLFFPAYVTRKIFRDLQRIQQALNRYICSDIRSYFDFIFSSKKSSQVKNKAELKI